VRPTSGPRAFSDSWTTPHQWRYELADNPSPALERRALLDRPSKSHPLLDALMNEALLRLLLTADGATSHLNARSTPRSSSGHTLRMKGRSVDRRVAPRSSLAADVETFNLDYLRARTHRSRLMVIKATQDAHSRIRHSQATTPSLVRYSVAWKKRIAADTRTYKAIQDAYGVSSKTIALYKAQYP
jgi:hypothetical protein